MQPAQGSRKYPVIDRSEKLEFMVTPKTAPGFRPGTVPEFQFDESTDLRARVKQHL
jgi:hypothetical protein